jgi:hypothetical protein
MKNQKKEILEKNLARLAKTAPRSERRSRQSIAVGEVPQSDHGKNTISQIRTSVAMVTAAFPAYLLVAVLSQQSLLGVVAAMGAAAAAFYAFRRV